jgi:hypothetical protein
MIKIRLEHNATGNGLGYQISSYVLLKSLAKHFGYEYGTDEFEFLNLRSTFEGVSFDGTTRPDTEYDKFLEFSDNESFDTIVSKGLEDESLIFGYPSPTNFYKKEYFEEVKKDLVFRKIIKDKCSEFVNKFEGQEIISLHIRRGDFLDPISGMFVCGDDYYQNALKLLPEDAKVFIFTNDKEYVKNNPLYQDDRFVLITDIYNDNQPINCDYGQLIDKMLDFSGHSRFNYKFVISQIAAKEVRTIKSIVDELHPKYLEKLKNKLYNHSFDLCLMTMCDYHISANSTFGMWGTTLSNSKKVIYPKYWMHGHVPNPLELERKLDLGDYDQTKDIGGEFMRDQQKNSIGIENPDQIISQLESEINTIKGV